MNIYFIDDENIKRDEIQLFMDYFIELKNSTVYWVNEKGEPEEEPYYCQAEYEATDEFLEKIGELSNEEDLFFVDMALNQKERIDSGRFDKDDPPVFKASTCGKILKALLNKNEKCKAYVVSSIHGIGRNNKWIDAIRSELPQELVTSAFIQDRFLHYETINDADGYLDYFEEKLGLHACDESS